MESLLTKLKCKWWLSRAKDKYERRSYAEALELIKKAI